MNIQEQIEKIISPLAEKENVEIVDIEYVKENGENILRIYIKQQDLLHKVLYFRHVVL